jgi:hypothetical protein
VRPSDIALLARSLDGERLRGQREAFCT